MHNLQDRFLFGKFGKTFIPICNFSLKYLRKLLLIRNIEYIIKIIHKIVGKFLFYVFD